MSLFSRKPVEEVIDISVPGGVVAPEDTVRPLEDIPQDDTPTDGDVPHNTNDAPELIEASNDQANNPIVNKKVKRDKSVDRKKDESQAEYNERVPVAVQPVQPGPTTSYLGKPL